MNMDIEDSLFSLDEAEFNDDYTTIQSESVTYNELVNGLKSIVKLSMYTGNYELLESYSEMLVLSNKEAINEGANAEYTESFKKHFRAANKYSRQGKKYFKACSFKTAKEYYQKANKEIQEMQKEFDKIDDTVLTSILGLFINYFVTAIPLHIGALLCFIPYLNIVIVGPVYVAAIGANIQELLELINLIKNWKDDDIVKNLNFYRNKLDTGMRVLQSAYLKKIKQCDTFMKSK